MQFVGICGNAIIVGPPQIVQTLLSSSRSLILSVVQSPSAGLLETTTTALC